MTATPSNDEKRRALLKVMSEKYLSQLKKEAAEDMDGPPVQSAPGE